MVFFGELNSKKMTLSNGVIDYVCKKYKTKIDISNNKFIGKQYIHYSDYIFYGKPECIEVIIKWKKNFYSSGNMFEWLFLPKIKIIAGFFKVSRYEASLVPEDYMNTR